MRRTILARLAAPALASAASGVGIARGAAADGVPAARPGGYLGAAACGACHPDAGWRRTARGVP